MDAGMRREHLYSDSGIEKPEKRKKKKAKKTLTTMTRICSQCGGTELASGHKVSVECVVDGTGRLIRFLDTNNEEAREVCRSGMAAGPFVCLSCEEKEVYPVEFFAVAHECSAMGFITEECAEVLEHDYKELAQYVAGILDDVDQETEDGCCSPEIPDMLEEVIWYYTRQ